VFLFFICPAASSRQHWLQLHFAEKLSEKLTGVAVAAQAKLRRRTFLRRFRRATGFNLKEYLQYLRVRRAREKLEFSSLPINEICCMVGYEDPGAFRKVFQRTMGLSPGEYRRRFGVADAE